MKSESWFVPPTASSPRATMRSRTLTLPAAPAGVRLPWAVALGAVAVWGLMVVLDPIDPSHLRVWACLAGVSAFLHVPQALWASRWITGTGRLAAAALQLGFAVFGASHEVGLVAAGFLVGAAVTIFDAVGTRGPSSPAAWGWAAFQLAAALLCLLG